ncbi:Serine--tRNA ligase [Yarrowia sp. E02]|nr:Serine--tRNA ligase [Yarrowia sp. E02]
MLRRITRSVPRVNVRLFSSASVRLQAEEWKNLKAPKHDYKGKISGIGQETIIREAIQRQLPEDTISRLEGLETAYQQYRECNQNYDEARSKQRKVSDAIKVAKDKKALAQEASEAKSIMRAMELKQREATATLNSLMELVPNVIHSTVPQGDDVEVLEILNPDRQYKSDLGHYEIGHSLNLLDTKTSANTSGYGWYYLLGQGAQLEQALVAYVLDKARASGWMTVAPPTIIRKSVAHACGFKPRDIGGEKQIYAIEDQDHCLAGTAEIPLAAWAADKSFKYTSDPVKVSGVSRSYRAEAGARGADTKGLYRVHEFTKVELFAWTISPESADAILEDMLAFQKSVVVDLGLKARVLNMPAYELGYPAAKKYDIEAWLPGRGDWGEITSTSNCLDYQSRRLHTTFKLKDTKKVYAQTLNGTALAVPRVIAAICESNYDPESQTISVPEVLQKYMGGITTIGAQDNCDVFASS